MNNETFNRWFEHFITDHADKTMLLIRKVEYIDVPSDVYKIYDFFDDDDNIPLYAGQKDLIHNIMDVEQEIVRGVRYFNDKGKEICIGIPKEIQGILGLPFSDFNRLENNLKVFRTENKKIRQELNSVTSELDEFKTMSFWKRLKFLFTKNK